MSEECVMEQPPAKKQKVETKNLNEESEKADEDKPNLDTDFASDFDVFGNDKGFAISEDKYNNFNTPEELDRLREFKVLDEVNSEDDDSNEESESSDGKSEGVPEEEIEKMLEEDLPDDFKGTRKQREKSYITRHKIVLEEKGVNHFEVLPLDWMMARHYSGLPIYMHRTTRVCTLSKPYFLGKGHTRRHDIPISAIPCLAYRKALEEEAKQKKIDKIIDDQIKNGTWQKNAQTTSQSICPKQLQVDSQIETCNSNLGREGNSQDSIEDLPNEELPQEKVLKCPFNHTSSNNITNTGLNEETNSKIDDNGTEKSNNGFAEDPAKEELSKTQPETNNTENKATIPQTEENIENDVAKNPLSTKTAEDDVAIVQLTNGNSHESIDSQESQSLATGDSQKTGNTDSGISDVIKDPSDLPLNHKPVVLPGGIVMAPPRVENVSTSWKSQHLTADDLNEYCRKLFKFKTVSIMHFKRWADRRKYNKTRKTLQYPTLPEGTKLITIPAQAANGPLGNGGGKSMKRDWVMNMDGRSYLSVFHEYVRRAMQKQPVYEFKQLENAATPYQATVFIGGMQYGVGLGSSKRAAKSAAARASIHVLIPEMGAGLETPATAGQGNSAAEPDFSFFDYVGIEDPRITEFCAATCEPSPHAILRTCLLRNFGAGDRHIHTEMKKLEYQKIELTMKVGKHSATVVCKNKKTAKQRASQAILQALHPHVRSWGSLLRLYGSRSVKSCKEKKQEEQQITLLQDAARHNEPNYAVLEKLRNEMRKLRERDEAVVPIGTLLVKDDLPTHSGSNLNNVDL